jgi:acyl carrier protein
MAEVWKRILKVEAVGPEDNFFKLGGDSLMAAELMAYVEETFGLQVDPVELFENPTLSNFVRVLKDEAAR